MNILSKLTNFVGGSLFKEIKEGVMAYFPPSMTPVQRAEAEHKISELLHKKENDLHRMVNESAALLDKRIAEQEGTASDLLQLPVVGRLVIFLRGLQRPVWGFFTMYLDFKWLLGPTDFTDQQQTALTMINLLVLGFLFGERTIKNLEPLILKILKK